MKSSGLEDLTCDINVLQSLAHTLKEKKNKVSVFIRMDKEIISVEPGWDEKFFGLALDVGTTTVALYLCDLKQRGCYRKRFSYKSAGTFRHGYNVAHKLFGRSSRCRIKKDADRTDTLCECNDKPDVVG